jgi:hypothetical protein
VDIDSLGERVAHLEGQVSRLLVALCCAFSTILVLIFYNRQPFLMDENIGTLALKIAGTVASAFVVAWPIVRWVVGKREVKVDKDRS